MPQPKTGAAGTAVPREGGYPGEEARSKIPGLRIPPTKSRGRNNYIDSEEKEEDNKDESCQRMR